MEKAKARIAGREQIGKLTAEEKAGRSAAIARELAALPELRAAKVIMAFARLPEEAELGPLWQDLINSGKEVVFPVLTGEVGRMDAARVSDLGKDLRAGRYGIRQPEEGAPVDPREIDIVVIPALAFDGEGNRVGRGGGYYDRFLAGRAPQAVRCGVCFECQVAEALPVKEHDCHVDILVTEHGVRRIGKRGLEP